MNRRRAVAAAVCIACTIVAAAAGTARASFPGANGRLIVNFSLFDPPAASTNPVLSYPISFPRFAADAKHIVGTQGSGASSAVYMADADGTNVRQLTTPPANGFGDHNPTWSADGKEVIFERLPRVSCGNSTCAGSELMAVDVQSGLTRAITGAGQYPVYLGPDADPDPSVHQVVAVVIPDGNSPSEVDLINTDTGARHKVLGQSGPYPAIVTTRFAPDSKSVVVGLGAPEDPSNSYKVQVVPVAAGGASLSFSVSAVLPTPTFTPDGQWLTFADCRSGACGVWSRGMPDPSNPGAPPVYREEVSYPSGGGAPGGATLDWEPLVDEPVITSGPSGRTNQTDATFEFSIPSQDQGKYQCRLDLGGWEDGCTSPKDYSGLADGDHEFDVRFYTQGQNPDDAPVATRRWTVDTTPPEAVIDQAPSGETTSTDASIFFHSTEPNGATFRCSLDGGAEYDCASPQHLSGLAVGAHTFAVKAIDDVGNEQSSPTEASWQVKEPEPSGGSGGGGSSGGSSGGGSSGGSGGGGSGTPPQTPTGDCPGGNFTKVTAGSVIAVGRGTTCFVRTAHKDGSVAWSAAGVITVNGVQLTGGPMILNQAGSSLSIELPAGTTLGFGHFSWTLTGGVTLPVTAAASAAHFLLPKIAGKFKVAGVPVTASPDFELSTKDGGSSIVSLNLELPKVISGAAGDDKGKAKMSFAFMFIASNDKGVRFTFRTTVTGAWLFGKVELQKLDLGLDQGPPLTFDGLASMKFPGVDGVFTIAVGLTGEGEQAFPLVNYLNLQASELEKPIAEGVFLQRLGGGFTSCVGDDKQPGGLLSANAGVSFGPKLTIPHVFEGEPASLDGNVTLRLCEPKSIAISGSGKIVEVPIGQATATYTWSTGMIDLSGKLTLQILGWGFTATVDNSFFDLKGKTWNVGASGQLKLPPWTGGVLDGKGEIVLSSNGFAACLGKQPGQRYGIGQHWGGDLQKLAPDCDVGPYRSGGSAARAAGAAGQQFTVPAHSSIELVTVHGARTPPLVTLTGPGGARLQTPAVGPGLQTRHALVGRDPAANATDIILFSPAAGTWTVTPEAGAAAPTSVQVADGLPAVRVSARVLRARKREQLTWTLRPIAGQKVTFIEHGAQTDRVLLSTVRARGRLRFTPTPGPGGRREIVALVEQGGLPRERLVVARFTAQPAPRLRAVSGLQRHGATVRWRSQPAAARYSVLLTTPSGATFATTTRRTRLQVPPAMRRLTLTVAISALDAAGNAGALRTRSMRP